jgi:hypothetical protein
VLDVVGLDGTGGGVGRAELDGVGFETRGGPRLGEFLGGVAGEGGAYCQALELIIGNGERVRFRRDWTYVGPAEDAESLGFGHIW